MGDIPGFLASEFPEDARDVPGQEAFAARKAADEEAAPAENIDETQIFYKQHAEAAPTADSDDETVTEDDAV
ncbi:hypothetical protein [Subtercola boreus]|uniref:Uncharacterized protein n=1 Tax=Subtercola boreus TaxID=120213 RepID=A0A3E0W938_9MICO|nr:hypothetical protein [Subtercola boreus]RFA18756.1 hypothetical protein B7R24_13490 [Subtercola boreus]RFA18873.1 hypothetical protein B7R23_13480 [Subtercola boreus]RFA25408.1 hypothetical protein B7R25_13590 [Subtercola boreus]